MVRINGTLNINTDACVVLTRKLEQMHRSGLPVAIRQTLNAAAFDVKKSTLQASANRNFIKRSPNFFKTFSRVNKAAGFNVRTMQAVVGMTAEGKGKAAETAVGNLGYQEEGGSIEGGLAYLKASRGGNNRKRVSRSNYFSKSKVVKNGPFKKARKPANQFIAKAYVSLATKKPMFFSSSKGTFLMQVTKIHKYKKGSNVKVTSKLLMKSRSGQPAKIKPTHFMREAAVNTTKKIEGFYVLEAKKQLERIITSR